MNTCKSYKTVLFLTINLFVSVCFANDESPAVNMVNDPLIQSLIETAVEHEEQVELFGMSGVPSQLAIEENGYVSAINYRKLQEHQKLWFVILISVMTPVFLFLALNFLKNSQDNSGTNIVNATGLVLVIQATVLIVVTSTTSEQLTAAIGVIAAIAGYLFGSSSQQQRSAK